MPYHLGADLMICPVETCGWSEMAAHGSEATYYDDSAALYADPKIRLHYPPELYERVYAFTGPAAETALDVACGTGQCAAQLAKRYKQARHFFTNAILKYEMFHVRLLTRGLVCQVSATTYGFWLLLLPCIPA